MVDFRDIVKIALDGVAVYQNAKRKNYENFRHILKKDFEVIIPDSKEIYIFDIEAWDFVKNDSILILTKKIVKEKEEDKKKKFNDNEEKSKNGCIDVSCIVKE